MCGSGLTPLSPGCSSGLDSEVLYRPGPSSLGDAELKQALLTGKSQSHIIPHIPGGKRVWGCCCQLSRVTSHSGDRLLPPAFLRLCKVLPPCKLSQFLQYPSFMLPRAMQVWGWGSSLESLLFI